MHLNADLPVFLCRYLSHLIALVATFDDGQRDSGSNTCSTFARISGSVLASEWRPKLPSTLSSIELKVDSLHFWVVFWRMLKVEHMNRMRRSWRRMSDGLIIINIVDSMLPEAVWSFWSWKSCIILHCLPLLACYASIQLLIFAAQTDSDLLSLPW